MVVLDLAPHRSAKAKFGRGMCQYYVGTGVQMLGWVHQDMLSRDGDLANDDGVVGTNGVDLISA